MNFLSRLWKIVQNLMLRGQGRSHAERDYQSPPPFSSSTHPTHPPLHNTYIRRSSTQGFEKGSVDPKEQSESSPSVQHDTPPAKPKRFIREQVRTSGFADDCDGTSFMVDDTNTRYVERK